MTKNDRRAVIYARISDDREGEARGVTRQVEDCRAKAEALGLDVVEIFTDNDIGASDLTRKHRPRYTEMLARAQRGNFGTIIAYSNSRLTRRPLELADLIALHKTYGVAISTVVSGDDDLSTADGRMVARIKVDVDAGEAERTGERVARAREQAAREGLPAPSVGYGYRRDGKQLVIAEAEAAVIRETVVRVLAGETLRSVATDLNKRGIEPPRRRNASTKWSGTTLRQMILRESLAGLRRHRGELMRDEDGQPLRAKWDPIITVEEHERIVALMNDPVRKSSHAGRAPVHLLSGILRCGRCGANMKRMPGRVATTKTGGTKRQPAAYACAECHRLRRNQAVLDDVVERLVIGFLSRPDAVEAFTQGDPADAEALREKIATLDARLANASDDYADGLIERDQLRRITERIRGERESMSQALHAALPKAFPVDLTEGDVEARWVDWTLDQKRAIIRHLLTVTVLPIGPGRARKFDPSWIDVKWNHDEPTDGACRHESAPAAG